MGLRLQGAEPPADFLHLAAFLAADPVQVR